VAGVDGTPGGWAVVIMDREQLIVRKIIALSELFDDRPDLKIVAVDVPIGLLERYEKGGRACDRAARQLLGKYRRSSVFAYQGYTHGEIMGTGLRIFAQ